MIVLVIEILYKCVFEFLFFNYQKNILEIEIFIVSVLVDEEFFFFRENIFDLVVSSLRLVIYLYFKKYMCYKQIIYVLKFQYYKVKKIDNGVNF